MKPKVRLSGGVVFFQPILDHTPFVDQKIVRMVVARNRFLFWFVQAVPFSKKLVVYGQVEQLLGQRKFKCCRVMLLMKRLL